MTTYILNQMRILIIQTAYIGDVILTTPLIKNIKNHFPDCLIDFLTIPASVNLVEKDPNIENVIVFDKRGVDKGFKGFKLLLYQIKRKKYNICICPHRSLRSAIIAYATRADKRIGFANSAWKYAFTEKVVYDQTIHETERNLSLLASLGITDYETRPYICSDATDEQYVEEILHGRLIPGKPLFAVAPGSIWATKRWPTSNFINILPIMEENGFQVILIGGKQDENLCESIVNQTDSGISLAGKLTLRQTKYFLTKCKALLSNDSAPLHLGLAANILSFGIFGATIKQFGFAPIEENSYVIENENLKCRPCNIHGSYKCPTKTFSCMEDIDEKDVIKRILSCIK